MDKLIDKFTNLSYEIFGIIIPGFFVVFFTLIVIWRAPFHQDPHYAEQILNLSLDGKLLWLLIASLAVYCVGDLASGLSRKVFPVKPKAGGSFRKFLEVVCLWPAKRNELQNCGKGKNDLETAKTVLNKMTNSNEALEWNMFYGRSSRLIQIINHRNIISTYQNKYTLHRSLAFLFIVFSRLFFLIFSISGIQYWCEVRQIDSSAVIINCFLLFSSLLFGWHFYRSFVNSWELFGDHTIWETINLPVAMQLREKK